MNLADVAPETVEWLAEPYVPIGKLTVLSGDPGVGKSHIVLSLAAAVSVGRGFPGMPETEPGVALIVSAEDGLADTVRPRLERMEAALSRIRAVTGAITFDADGLRRLEQLIVEHRPRVVIVDPIVAYVGARTDTHRANELRAITAPLAALAQHYRCAILITRHLTKAQGGKAIYRGQGSIDLTAAARSELIAGVDPDDPSRRAVIQVKNNLAPFGEPQGYALDPVRGLLWTGSTELTAERLLGVGRPDASVQDEAVAALERLLADGPLLAHEVFERMTAEGFSKSAVRRAKTARGIESKKGGMHDGWYWRLPDDRRDGAVDDADAHEDGHEAAKVINSGRDHLQDGLITFGDRTARQPAHANAGLERWEL